MSSLPDTLVRFRTDLEQAIDRDLAARTRRARRGRRVFVIAVATLLVALGAASAFGAAHHFLGESKHVYHGVLPAQGKMGDVTIHLMFGSTRRWEIRPVAFVPGGGGPPSGQYVDVTGGGRVVQVGGHQQSWRARLEGFVARAGSAKQRVVVIIRGRPNGFFVIRPLQDGAVHADSGSQSSTWMG